MFFGDERFIPPEHDDSNEGMVRRVLLDHVQPRAVYPMYRAGSIEDAADAYDTLMREHPPIELAHLGVGPDGHTASLFPGSPALDVTDRLVVATGDDAPSVSAHHVHLPGHRALALRRRHGGGRRQARRDAPHRGGRGPSGGAHRRREGAVVRRRGRRALSAEVACRVDDRRLNMNVTEIMDNRA